MRHFLFLLSAIAFAAPANADWHEASSEHFIVYSEGSTRALEEYATNLERYDKAMRYLRGLPDRPLGPANRLTVYLVTNVGDVRELAGDRSGSLAGFYIGRASGSVAIVPRRSGNGGRFALDSETILLHEYAHHFMMQNYPAAYPGWFSEGFAEFHATTRFEDDGGVGIGLPAMHRAYGLVTTRLPIEKLLAPGDHKLNDREREAIYGLGWLLTHYLTFEESRSGQLAGYLKALNRGEDSLPAAREAFGDLDALEEELEDYRERRRMQYLKIAPEALVTRGVTIRKLTPGEEAVMDLKIQSRRGVTEEQARELLPKMRRAAAAYPNEVAVQTTLAEAEYDAGYYAEAAAAVDRALAVDPKSIDALIYKGRVLMAMAEAARSTDPAVWREARRWFVAANRVDPDDPEPLILFYQSFLAAGREPTANSVVGLNRAFELAPQDLGLRMMTARQYLIDGKTAEARGALAPIAFNPHGGGAATMATAVIEAIDSTGGEAALEAWTGPPQAEATDAA